MRQAHAEPLRWTSIGLTQREWDRMLALASNSKSGFPRSKSEFIRQAVDEKLDSVEAELLDNVSGTLAA